MAHKIAYQISKTNTIFPESTTVPSIKKAIQYGREDGIIFVVIFVIDYREK